MQLCDEREREGLNRGGVGAGNRVGMGGDGRRRKGGEGCGGITPSERWMCRWKGAAREEMEEVLGFNGTGQEGTGRDGGVKRSNKRSG